jgi:hypothetical protein
MYIGSTGEMGLHHLVYDFQQLAFSGQQSAFSSAGTFC